MQEGQCDLDQQANGTCTFGFFCLEVCGRLVESVAVPVGQARIVERPNLPLITVTQHTLRCVRSPGGREIPPSRRASRYSCAPICIGVSLAAGRDESAD